MIDVGVVGWEIVLQNGIDVELEGPSGLAGGAVGAFVTTLAVGALLIAFAPEYTEGMVGEVLTDPVGSVLYGVVVLLALGLSIVGLVLTVVGVFLAIPLVVAAYLTWAVGATITFLAVGERLVGREDGWAKPLAVAAAINGGLALTGIGGIVSFVLGALGFGAVIREYLD